MFVELGSMCQSIKFFPLPPLPIIRRFKIQLSFYTILIVGLYCLATSACEQGTNICIKRDVERVGRNSMAGAESHLAKSNNDTL